MRFRFRRLDEGDAEAWQRLLREGARDFPLGFIASQDDVVPDDLERCGSILQFGGTFGVFENGLLIGVCGYQRFRLQRVGHRAEVGPFYVTAARQGSGAADCLMSGIKEIAAEAGVDLLELAVDTENHRAIAFYERHGFRRFGLHEDAVRINGECRDDYLYSLRLS